MNIIDAVNETSINVFKKCNGVKRTIDNNQKSIVSVCPLRNICSRFISHYQKKQVWIEYSYNKIEKECKQFIEFKKNDY